MADNQENIDNLNKGAENLNQSSKDRQKFLEKENFLLKEQLKLQAESLDLSSSIVDSIKEVLGISTKRTTSDANLLKVNKEINKAILNQERGLGSIENITKRIAKNEKVLEKGKKVQESLESSLTKKEKEKADIAKRAYEIRQNTQKAIEHELAAAERGEKINQDTLNALYDKAAYAENISKQQEDGLTDMQKQYIFTTLNNKELQKQQDIQQGNLDLANEIQDLMGVTGKTLTAIGKIPGIGQSAAKAFKKVNDELQEMAENGEELPSSLKVAGMQAKEFGKNLIKDALDPATLVAAAFKSMKDAMLVIDKRAGDFAKSQGISYERSLGIATEMRKAAVESGDLLVNQGNTLKAQESLNTLFGSSAKFSGTLATEVASVSERTGMAEDSMALFVKESMRSGKSIKDNLKTQTAQVMEMNKQKGLQMSVKQVQDAIGKTAKSLQLTFKGSTEELTKQVMSVKALGSNMQQTEQIASSLLNFESSIQSELEAELLLGKDINLEKARAAALEGDRGKMAEEVMKNTAIMNAFETKNVIAQEAAAKALGLSRDDLANMVDEQQKMNDLRDAGFESNEAAQEEYNKLRNQGLSAEEAALEIGDDNLAKQLEAVSATQKLESATARVQELFIAMAEPIMAIITPLVDILEPILSSIAGFIDYMIKGFKIMAPLIGVVAGAIAIMNAQAIAGAIAGMIRTAFTTFSGIPFVGFGLAAAAVAAGVGMISSYTKPKKTGDMMSPADGKTQVSTAEGGLFELSPNDDLIAAPGAANAMTKKGEKGGGAGGGSAALISEVRTLININRQILAKSSVIEMNGNQVGEEINQSERKVQ